MSVRERAAFCSLLPLFLTLAATPMAWTDDDCGLQPCEHAAAPDQVNRAPGDDVILHAPLQLPPEMLRRARQMRRPQQATPVPDSPEPAGGDLDASSAAAIESMDACGDSISKAFNGHGSFPCSNADEESFNYATSDTHETSLCSAGAEGVFSVAERLECLRGADIVSRAPNAARSGAQMLKDFVNQAESIRSYLLSQPAPRFVPVLMGHNDLCGGNVFKYALSCAQGGDQDRNFYCRTTPAAFERELRKGLDRLITVPDLRIGVASMVRVSQLCNHAGKTNCQTFTSCQNLWSLVGYTGWIFGQSNGICGSLTLSCSAARVRDAYTSAKANRNVLQRVAAEYEAVPPGGTSPVVAVGGQTVGGAEKAAGVAVVYSDAPWRYSFPEAQLNCCDCFHPSPSGQNAAARVLFQGFTCTAAEPCCQDTSDRFRSGRCLDLQTDGTFISGLLN